MSENDYSAGAEASLASGFSDTGDAAADEVSNRTGGDYDESDSATETGTSTSDATATWHQARDDEDEDKGTDRHEDNSGWFS